MKAWTTRHKVAESNRIEGIRRLPTAAEVEEFERFVMLKTVTLDDLCKFVSIYQPNARLRDKVGLDVRVGRHFPPPGSYLMPHRVAELLAEANTHTASPWVVHLKYENLHPFTDANGRSGRMLWYWMMGPEHPQAGLGFLHAFYYQTLDGWRPSYGTHES